MRGLCEQFVSRWSERWEVLSLQETEYPGIMDIKDRREAVACSFAREASSIQNFDTNPNPTRCSYTYVYTNLGSSGIQMYFPLVYRRDLPCNPPTLRITLETSQIVTSSYILNIGFTVKNRRRIKDLFVPSWIVLR